MPEYLYWLWGGGGVAFAGGIVLLAIARAADRRNYIIQRATPLPLSLVNVRDDVWLRGRGEAELPVTPPHFGLSCLYYDYKLEERVRRTRHTKRGTETYYTWETRQTECKGAIFRLSQSELSISIDGGTAEWKDLFSKTDRAGKWRHTLHFIPSPHDVSATGSVGEKREWLEKYGNIPLMVTPKTRSEYVKDAERAEKIMRGLGFFLFWAGLGVALYGLFDFIQWPVDTRRQFEWATLGAAAAGATSVYLPVWALYIFNTFVAYRHRVNNAWRQIDVDLKMRYDLIPRLVSAVKGYLQHEQNLLERVSELRSRAVSGGADTKKKVEGEVENALDRMSIVVENYPELKSQPLVSRLMREMQAIEEKIMHGRTVYNEAVREYNENVMMFPRMLLARIGGFREVSYFTAADHERKAVKVDMGPGSSADTGEDTSSPEPSSSENPEDKGVDDSFKAGG